MLEATEQYVVERLFAELDKPGFLDALVADQHASRRSEIIDALSGVDAQRRELAELWGTPGGLTTAEWQGGRAALADTERQARAALAAKPPAPAAAGIPRAPGASPVLELAGPRDLIRLVRGRATR